MTPRRGETHEDFSRTRWPRTEVEPCLANAFGLMAVQPLPKAKGVEAFHEGRLKKPNDSRLFTKARERERRSPMSTAKQTLLAAIIILCVIAALGYGAKVLVDEINRRKEAVRVTGDRFTSQPLNGIIDNDAFLITDKQTGKTYLCLRTYGILEVPQTRAEK